VIAGRARAVAAVFTLALLALAEAAYAEPVTLKLGLLAVKPQGAGYEGVVIDTVVSLAPGQGRLLLEPRDLVDDSTRYSTLLGFILATAMAGKDYRLYDMTVQFETDTPVGGPSASGFLAATVLLLALGYAPHYEEATMTGMVSPSGLVLSVAGVEAKAAAAARHGYRLILVPAQEAAGLKTPGGARVVPVCSVIDAASQLDNVTLFPSLGRALSVPVPPVFGRDAERFANYTEQLLPLLDNATRARVARLVEEARALTAKRPYVAASLAFTALLQAANETIARHGFSVLEQKLGITLQEALEEARRAVAGVSYEAGGGLCYAWSFASLAAASYRLYLAEHVSDQAAPYFRALSLLRALSARTWAEAASTLRGPLVPCSYLYKAAAMTLHYTHIAADYFISILDKPFVRVFTHLIDNRTIREWLSDAENALNNGDYLLAVGLTVYVLSEIEFRMDAPNTATQCLTEYAERLTDLAGPAFAVPALYYHNYALYFTANESRKGETGEALTVVKLETAALAWMVPGLFLHAASAPAPTGAAEAATQAPIGAASTPYLLVAAEALLLAVVGAAAARAAAGREKIEYTRLP